MLARCYEERQSRIETQVTWRVGAMLVLQSSQERLPEMAFKESDPNEVREQAR